MTAQTKTVLKGYFNTGDIPTEAQLANLIDTVGAVGLVVAASDASDASKGRADYVCDGTADQVEILAAMTALGAQGGKLTLSAGTFNLTAALPQPSGPVIVAGMGMTGTVLNFAFEESGDCVVPVSYMTLRDLSLVGDATNTRYGVRLDNGIAYTLLKNLWIADMADVGVRADTGNSQNELRRVITKDCLNYGFYLYGVANRLYNCQAMRGAVLGVGGSSGFRIQSTGLLLSGCVAERYTNAFEFQNYAESVSVVHPHIEFCTTDFRVEGLEPEPTKLRVYGGLFAGVVVNPNESDLTFL